MKLRRLEVYLITLLLSAVVIFLYIQETQKDLSLTFAVMGGGKAEKITCWQQEDGDCFVFLPSYVDLSETWVQTNQPIRFDETELRYGETCEKLRLEHTYRLSRGGEDAGTITFMQSEKLPAMYIDTASQSMDYIHAVKGNKEYGKLRLYNSDGTLDYAGGLESIQGRGNSTFEGPKKPYNLKLIAEANLLGMGDASRWILLGDSTNLNNKLVYDFAAAAGLPYSPESRWVDLYLNGEYAGLYLLCERNEIHPQRVALPDNRGILVSKEQLDSLLVKEQDYFITDAGVSLRIHASSFQEEKTRSLFQSAENAILAEDGIDPWTGKHWTELIDLDSWARKYLVEEIFCGIDSAVASQFFFYRGDGTEGKIYAGPVWDYDDTMHAVWIGGEDLLTYPQILYAHRSRECQWYHELYYDEQFYDYLKNVYKNEISDLLKYFVDEKLPEYMSLIEKSYAMSQIRWDNSDLSRKIQGTRAFILERRAFLNSVWNGDREYAEVSVDFVRPGSAYKSIAFDYMIPAGESLPEIPTIESYSWYIAGTDCPFDITQPIFEDTAIELRKNQE